MYSSQFVTEEESRNARRKTHHDMSCRFDNDPHVFKIHELSAHGFSFVCSKDLAYFKRGVVLEKIRITNAEGVEIIVASGRIAHSTEFDFEQNRFGVNYTKKILDRTIAGKVRVPRHFPELQLDVLMKLPQEKNGWSVLGTVKDFTASTSRIGIRDDLSTAIKVGDEVEIVIKAGKDEIYQSSIHVIRMLDDVSEIIVRFIDKFLDVNLVKTISTAHQNRKIISSAVQSLKTYNKVSDQFKALVCDWCMYLKRLSRVLQQEESKNIYRSQAEEEYFLRGIEGKVFTDLREFIAKLNEFGDSLATMESIPYKKYFRENIGPFLRNSPLIASIMDKDLGYAGDFETVKQFFQNPYCGDSLFGKLLNKFICSLEAVTAHQDRIQFLADELESSYKNSSGSEFSFLSLGSGPAEEVLRFIEHNEFAGKPIRASLLDMDSYALADFSERLQYTSRNNLMVDLININIMNILRKKSNDPVPGQYSFTYCAGLFDYFGDNICRKLVLYLLKHTLSGGKAIITNVHRNNIARHFMNYGGGWEIIHRDEEEMIKLIPEGYEYSIHTDDKDTNIYIVISVD